MSTIAWKRTAGLAAMGATGTLPPAAPVRARGRDKGPADRLRGRKVLLGRSHAGGWAFGTAEEFSGIRVVDDEGVVLWEHNALGAPEPDRE